MFQLKFGTPRRSPARSPLHPCDPMARPENEADAAPGSRRRRRICGVCGGFLLICGVAVAALLLNATLVRSVWSKAAAVPNHDDERKEAFKDELHRAWLVAFSIDDDVRDPTPAVKLCSCRALTVCVGVV